MGSDGSKAAASAHGRDTDQLSRDELQRLRTAFFKSGTDDGTAAADVDQVQRLLTEVLADEFMSTRLCHLIPSKNGRITWSGLTTTVTQLLKGPCSEQCRLLFRWAGPSRDDGPVTSEDLITFVSGFVRAYLADRTSAWNDICRPAGRTDIIAVYLLGDLSNGGGSCDLEAFERWYCQSPLIARIIRTIVRTAFRIGTEDDDDGPLLPACDSARGPTRFESILTLPEVLLLNHRLPASLRHRWRFLFSSRQYGQSFSQLIRRIVGRGPTLVVIRNKQEEVFGGFASESWQMQSKFHGTSESFLLTLRPRMGIFTSTGYNDHYMYLNLNQQTMPNGLGMGGQLEYFGLYVSNDYGRGTCSKSCTTFHSPQLSSESDFDIETLEVWGVGPEPKPEEGTRSSALDTLDPELKAILEMADRAPISDAIREQDRKDPASRDTTTETKP